VTALFDANALIALVVSDHVHHAAAAEWLSASETDFATCPITEGALVRFLLRAGQSVNSRRSTAVLRICTMTSRC
jgi:uncharacterized protein